MRRRFLVGALAVLLMGCSGRMPPLDVHRLSTREAIEKSSTVVVGVVRDISMAGGSQRTDEGVWVRTWRVEVNPICILKGTTTGKNVEFVLNNYDTRVGVQNGDFEWLQIGDRRVFFLAAQGPILRSVCDLYKTSLFYPHSGLPAVVGRIEEPIGNRVAMLLLGKEPTESPQNFAKMIPRATTESLKSAGYPFVASMLGRLAASEMPDVKTEACLTAYEQVFGGEACILELEGSGVAPEVSRRIVKARERRAYLRHMADQALHGGPDCPLLSYAYGVEPADPVSIVGFLKFLAQLPDPIFRASAERDLRHRPAPTAE